MKARDLSVGDTLHLPGRYVLVTRLNPSTAEATIAAGAREVFSGSWSNTFAADEHVTATPRQAAEVRENAADLNARYAEDDETREQIGQLLTQPTGRTCETGRCGKRATAVIQSCGAVYVCDDCRAQIDRLSQELADETTAARRTWTPNTGDTVTREGHDGEWIVSGYEDDDTVWLHRPGTRLIPAYGRLPGWVDLSGGRLVPEHTELAAVTELRPAAQAEAVSRG